MKLVVFPLLLFVSFGCLNSKMFKLETVFFMFSYSAEPNMASKVQHQSNRDDFPGGQAECSVVPMSKVTKPDNNPNPVVWFSLLHTYFHCQCSYILVIVVVKESVFLADPPICKVAEISEGSEVPCNSITLTLSVLLMY